MEFLFNKVPGLNVGNFIKKRLQQQCFPVISTKCLRAAFFKTPLMVTSVSGEKCYEGHNTFKTILVSTPILHTLKTVEKPLAFWCFQRIQNGNISQK